MFKKVSVMLVILATTLLIIPNVFSDEKYIINVSYENISSDFSNKVTPLKSLMLNEDSSAFDTKKDSTGRVITYTANIHYRGKDLIRLNVDKESPYYINIIGDYEQVDTNLIKPKDTNLKFEIKYSTANVQMSLPLMFNFYKIPKNTSFRVYYDDVIQYDTQIPPYDTNQSFELMFSKPLRSDGTLKDYKIQIIQDGQVIKESTGKLTKINDNTLDWIILDIDNVNIKPIQKVKPKEEAKPINIKFKNSSSYKNIDDGIIRIIYNGEVIPVNIADKSELFVTIPKYVNDKLPYIMVLDPKNKLKVVENKKSDYEYEYDIIEVNKRAYKLEINEENIHKVGVPYTLNYKIGSIENSIGQTTSKEIKDITIRNVEFTNIEQVKPVVTLDNSSIKLTVDALTDDGTEIVAKVSLEDEEDRKLSIPVIVGVSLLSALVTFIIKYKTKRV